MRVLVGDIGGTKTLLQLIEFDAQTSRGRTVAEQSLPSQHYPTLGALVSEFLQANRGGPINAACLALAGPVHLLPQGGEQVQLTNLPWNENSRDLAEQLQIPKLRFINDFQAVGYGIEALTDDELLPLQAGEPLANAPRLIVGAGTGLGVALLLHDGSRYQPLPTEAGHSDFAPASEQQWRIKESLARRYSHVSWERLVSGPGLEGIFRYLASTHPGEPTEHILQADDIPATIASFALAGDHMLAEQALDLFVELYGSFTGNMALACLPRGGVFIAGGIAPKIRDRMARGDFITAFLAKGRMSQLLAAMPVHLVTQPAVGLVGTAQAARHLCWSG